MKKVISSKSAIFVDVLVKPDQKIVPKLEFGRPIEDLSPKLSDKEFEKEMVVETLRKIKYINTQGEYYG